MSSRSWNRVELIGNLTRDPELRYTPNGAAVCTFGVATNRTYVSEGEKKEEVDFHRLVSWNKLAELCNQLLKKGHRVFISGRLQTRSWEGADGQSRQTTEIVIEDMILLTPRDSGEPVAVTEVLPEEKKASEKEEVVDDSVVKTTTPVSSGKSKDKDMPESVQEKNPPQEEVEDLPF